MALFRFYDENPKAWQEVQPFYAENPKAWIRDFCVTYDPRKQKPQPKTMPFIMFPRQEDLIDCLQECVRDRESMLAEKARDMGASWTCGAFSAHQWLFIPGTAIGWGSRKEQLVDKLGDPDSIFEKIRMIISHLPAFCLPNGWNPSQHALHLRIVNPENGSIISGEGGDNIGRGGRKTMYFKDESAHYERPDKIEAALGDNTDVQIDISSVNGTGNVFHRRRMAGVIWNRGEKLPKNRTRVFIMDWSDHPAKNQEWYEARKSKAKAEGLLKQFAQEIDRDYSSSVEGVIIKPEWARAAVDAHKKLGFEAEGEKVAGLDVADEGGDQNAFAGRHGVVLKRLDKWGEGDPGLTCRKSISRCVLMGIDDMWYDSIGVGVGVKVEARRMAEDGLLPKGLTISPWNAGGKVIHPDRNLSPGDVKTPKNKDYFENISAQAMWSLGQRFYKTFLAVTEGEEYDSSELISIDSGIDNLQELLAELSQITQGASKSGKMIINKKPPGTRSPNLADAVKKCYFPARTGINYMKFVNR